MTISEQYICDTCKKVFNNKNNLTKHKNKKDCMILSETNDNKNILINIFKSCLNILRDNEGLTGEKALRNLSYLLILKLIEPHLGNDIDIDNYDYHFESHFEDEDIETNKKRLLGIIRFSNLAIENDDNIPNIMKYAWDIILSVHPTTKKIFIKDKGFDIQHKSTYKNLIDKLNSLDLSNTDYDILGNAYEEVIQDIMTGKILGQFFTQPLIKKMMVKLINPQIFPDGKIETCGDPTMGTGGFLISYLKYILDQANIKNIKPDWNYIKTYGIYGKEVEPDTYMLAVSNMLISSGHMFEQLERGDSIRNPITLKFDNILANPPFGIKGLKYDDIYNILKNEYIPIKTDNAISLFIQAIIYMLKINGKCAVVLPDGQDLFSKTNITLILIRKYLMKTCDLKEIIYLPSGIFTYTSIKTCVFYFVKKKEGIYVLETNFNITKSLKNNQSLKFIDTHETKQVQFYDYNPYEDIKSLLIEVPIEKIINNSYSLNYTEYINNENKEEYTEEVIIKTLGEICKFMPKSKRNAKYGNKEGLYPFFKSSMKIDSYVNEPDYTEESLIIGDGGEPNINYGIKFSASDHCYVLQNINTLLLNLKYVYYYLYHNLTIMNQLYTGVAIKNISKSNIEKIKVPISTIEKQEAIIKYLDFIYEKTNKISQDKINDLKQLNKFCLDNQKLFGDNEINTLGEICEFLNGKKRNAHESIINGKYKFVTCSVQGYSYLNDYDFEDTALIINSVNGSGKCMIYCTDKYSTTNNNFHFKIKHKDILTEYIYYYLYHNIKLLEDGFIGANQKKISKNYLINIKIYVPSFECQNNIIKYCDYNVILINQLEQEIKNNKLQAHKFIKNILSHNIIENTVI